MRKKLRRRRMTTKRMKMWKRRLQWLQQLLRWQQKWLQGLKMQRNGGEKRHLDSCSLTAGV